MIGETGLTGSRFIKFLKKNKNILVFIKSTLPVMKQSVKSNIFNYQVECPRGNGVMDSALACHAGGWGSIPAVGFYSNGFVSLSGIGVRKKLSPDTLKWCS